MPRAAHLLIRLVVRHDEQDVGARILLALGEPVSVSESGGELIEPRPDTFINHRKAFGLPAFAVLEILHVVAFHDRWLDGVERREHPAYRLSPRDLVGRQQAGVALGDVKHDGPGLEQGDVAVFIGWDLTEGLEAEVRRFLHLFKRDETHIIRLADFLQRPTDAHIPG